MPYTGDYIVNNTSNFLRGLLIVVTFLAFGCDRAENSPAATTAKTGSDTTSETPVTAPLQPLELKVEELQKIFTVLNPVQKAEFLKNTEAFAGFVKQESQALSLSAAARANKIQEDPNVLYIMGRMSENVLREAYLERLMTDKIPADFPTKEQVKEFYEKNHNQFVVEDRVHLWQIFLKVADVADKAEVARQKELATKIVGDIRTGKTDFSGAAQQYSDHEPSRINAGYMGVLRFSEMKPGIADVVRNLKVDAVSDPFITDEGVHIIKRGLLIPKQELPLDRIEPQVRELLIKQAKAQLRQTVLNKAAETYPVTKDDQAIESWRHQLMDKSGTN
jgi:hypothetical protein